MEGGSEPPPHQLGLSTVNSPVGSGVNCEAPTKIEFDAGLKSDNRRQQFW